MLMKTYVIIMINLINVYNLMNFELYFSLPTLSENSKQARVKFIETIKL